MKLVLNLWDNQNNWFRRLYLKQSSLFKIVVLGVFVFFVSPFLIHLILSNPNVFSFVKLDNSSAWIGYFGSIIGGLLTIFGVIITINSQAEFNRKDQEAQNDLNEKNLRSKYFPILIIEKVDENEFHDRTVGICIDSSNNKDVLGLLRIKNIGDNLFKNLQVQCIVDNQDDKGTVYICTGYIVKNDEYYLSIYGDSHAKLSNPIQITLYFTYEDSIEHIYQVKVNCQLISTTSTNSEWITFFLDNFNGLKPKLISENTIYVNPSRSLNEYDLSKNYSLFEESIKKFYESNLNELLNKIDNIVFEKYRHEYNSGWASGPKDIKLINDYKCKYLIEKGFFYHGKQVFLYSYVMVVDLKKELVIFKKFKVEQNLNFCNIPNIFKIYTLAHRRHYRIDK